MTTTDNVLRIGSKVSGIYFGVPFTGMVIGSNYNGDLSVRLDSPITVKGSIRDGLFIFNDRSPERGSIKVIGQTEREVVCRYVQGHIFSNL